MTLGSGRYESPPGGLRTRVTLLSPSMPRGPALDTPGLRHDILESPSGTSKEAIMQVEIGISEQDRQRLADGLAKLLADTYTLYLKTHNFHWNVKGPMFQTLHLMFEQHYTELAMAVDLVAERIRALGHPAPGTYSAYAKLSSIPETDGVPQALDMVKLLVEAHEAVIRTARNVVSLAEETRDQATADLGTQRLQLHEK